MWEYVLLEETNEKKLVERLNELGKEKWEAFGYTLVLGGVMGRGHHFVLLKRQR